jgi:hypothetical protein
MTTKSQKPVHQCEGCQLNMGTHCRAFHHPAEKWAHGDCEGYNNQDLLKIYRMKNDGQGIYAAKLIRQKKAKDQHDVEKPEEHTKFKKLKFP